MDRPQMRIPLSWRCSDGPSPLANRLRFTELGQQGGRRVPQRVERGAVEGAAEGSALHGAPQAAANGLGGPGPVLDDIGIGALPGALENEPQLIADGDDLQRSQSCDP